MSSSGGHGFGLFGTLFFDVLTGIMGASIEGSMEEKVFFQRKDENNVVDECQIDAHVQIGKDMTVEPSVHSGVLHEGCFSLAGNHRLKAFMREFDLLTTGRRNEINPI
mmetsp:Transcript_49588/g.73895  ORF Transcript_49588/g.73895 Transcript_49588/m.73895 type:complete len:108 (-) Transcript_49588:1795-2118(-)